VHISAALFVADCEQAAPCYLLNLNGEPRVYHSEFRLPFLVAQEYHHVTPTSKGGYSEVSPKVSILALLIVVAALTGCNQANAPNAKATFQIGGSQNEASTAEEITANKRREEELRLANERVKLAEERAELEKQKREFAEQQLKAAQESNEESEYQGSSVSNNSGYSTSQQSRSHHTRSQPSYTLLEWCDEEYPDIGEIIEDCEGNEYEVIGYQGRYVKGIILDDES
jgi:hypothetical protein